MRCASARGLLFGVGVLLTGCSQPIASVPRWDANVDAPRGETGPSVATPRSPGRGGSTGTTGTTPTDDCHARILVLFDRSGSMKQLWEGGSVSGPRWELAADALTNALTPLADRLEVGAILFPSESEWPMPGDACPPVDPISAQLDYRDGAAFLSAWSTLWSMPVLLGGTPIDSAFDSADDALDTSSVVTAVVLLTDGEPTCAGTVSAETRAASWHARGIDTWVVGLPGAGTSTLDAIAAAGGTGTALSVTDPAALTTALGSFLSDQVDQACGD